MRVVFDTVVLVRGLINPCSRCGRLLFVRADAYLLIVSPPVIAEYLDVLRRPELTRKYRSIATRDSRAVLDLLATAEVVELIEIPMVSRDREDDPFLATAHTGAADYLVSEDRDLLDLGAHEGTPIVTAETFVGLLGRTAGGGS